MIFSEFRKKLTRKFFAHKFDAISGNLFLLGMVTSRFREIPIPIVSSLILFLSMLAYLVGYTLWFVASMLHPPYARKPDSWLGFASFRTQYQVAAILGIAAAIMWFFFPIMIIPAAWLFLISNLIWTISEHHKKINPPPDHITDLEKLKYIQRQSVYCQYTKIATFISLMTAVGLTLALIFPPAAAGILIVTGILGIFCTVISLGFLMKASCGKFEVSAVDDATAVVSELPAIKNTSPTVGKTSSIDYLDEIDSEPSQTTYVKSTKYSRYSLLTPENTETPTIGRDTFSIQDNDDSNSSIFSLRP